ncbi:hypothetical protein [Nitrobacter winogradskyi]|uniref:Uncharacterized protein n=1 Tax=Nitrobacter winogradskyi TaxID=913 RepID=A0ACC6AHC2_NITWI|nr:hypothetical protein [Nitrobacter winogradskyi]MCP1998789.1 hypothetical protein [Nitrobacter winogradskyi]
MTRKPVDPRTGWPREVVVDHGDGTVSLLANVDDLAGGIIRVRRVDDVFRELAAS